MTAHPLALALVERLRSRGQTRVLEFASGRGRNLRAMSEAGLAVTAIGDDVAASADPFAGIRGPFDAALSTHGLLHGTSAAVEANLARIAALLGGSAPLYATFGSSRDARFGHGGRIDDFTFAALDGDEAGVPHAFFDRERLTAMLAPLFAIESLEERRVDEVAGSWAHEREPLARAVHWFLIATVK